jgi:uncharacterized membrane protein YgcG
MTSIRNHKATTVLSVIAFTGLLLVSTSAIESGHTALAANDDDTKVSNNKYDNSGGGSSGGGSSGGGSSGGCSSGGPDVISAFAMFLFFVFISNCNGFA